jgi:chemotaxis methyl-accepting protein methylase
MALLDAGLPAERLRIDAIDISTRALDLARLGLYGRNSFRGADLTFRDRHFTAKGATGACAIQCARRCISRRAMSSRPIFFIGGAL